LNWSQPPPMTVMSDLNSSGSLPGNPFDSKAILDGKGAHTHYEQIYISPIEPRARRLHRLYQTLR
jgi:hypothetical protein